MTMYQPLTGTAVVTAWQNGNTPATGYMQLNAPAVGSRLFDTILFTHTVSAPRTVRAGTQVTELRLSLASLPTEIVPNPKSDTLQLKLAISRSPNPADAVQRADELIGAAIQMLKSPEFHDAVVNGSRLMSPAISLVGV